MQLRNKPFGVLSGLLSAMLVINGVPAFAEEETVQMYFPEGFDGYNPGQAPSGWTLVDNGNKITVENVPSEANKSLKYTVSDADVYAQKSSLGLSARQFVVDFSVRADSATLGATRIELRDSSGKSLVPVSLKNGQIVLYDYFSIGRYSAGKFYRISIAFDLDTKKVSAWVNGSQRVRNYSIGDAMLENLAFIRLHTTEISEKSSVYWDYISVYDGTQPAAIEDDEDSDESIGGSGVSYTMKNAVAMYENRPWALVGGKKQEIDKDKEIVPFSKGDTMYLPLRFIANSFGASVEYNADSGSTTVAYAGKAYTLVASESLLLSDGEEYRIDAPVINKNDRLFIPLSAIYNIFGKEVFIDENGLMIFSDESDFVSWEDNFDLLNDIVKAFIYTDYSSEELLEMFGENNPDNVHTRVMVSADTFSKMRELVAADEFAKAAYRDVVAKADAYLAEKPSFYDISDGVRLLTTCRRVQDRVATLALVYNISGDEKYAKRAWEELYIAAYFPNWNESHFLDVAEMSAAFAIGYDWLYDYPDEEQKQLLVDAVKRYAFDTAMDDYTQNPNRQHTFAWSVPENANNWNLVCNGGIMCAAIAMLDEPAVSEYARQILDCGMTNILSGISLYAPTGDWEEGHNTLVINPGSGDDQFRAADCRITEHGFGSTSYTISDITKAYIDAADSIRRGVKLTNDRSVVVVRDEIKLKKSSELYWFVHIDAHVTLSEDKKTAVLEMNGKYMQAKILEGSNAEFEVMNPEPLPTSPNISGQSKNTGCKIAIHLTDFTQGATIDFTQYTLEAGQLRGSDSADVNAGIYPDPANSGNDVTG